FRRMKCKYFFKTISDFCHAVKRQSNYQVKMHFHLVLKLCNDSPRFVEVLFPAYCEIGLLIDGLNTNLESEQTFRYTFIDESDNISMQNIRGDLKLKDVSWTVVLEDVL